MNSTGGKRLSFDFTTKIQAKFYSNLKDGREKSIKSETRIKEKK